MFPVPASLADTQIGSASVAHQKRQGQGDDGHREYHVGGAVSQKTNAPSNKYLVYNIIEGGHQQRHDAGYGKSQHQLSDGFFRHILVCILIHNNLRFFICANKKAATFREWPSRKKLQPYCSYYYTIFFRTL